MSLQPMYAQPEETLPKQDSAMTSNSSQLSVDVEKDFTKLDCAHGRDLDKEATLPPHAHDEEAGFRPAEGLESDEKPRSDLLDWESPRDPAIPTNWSLTKKLWITVITCYMTFTVTFGSSIFSAMIADTAEQFHVSEEVMILGVTLYVLGFACGPMIFGPMSEAYGRQRPLLFGFALFVIFQAPVAAAENLQTVLICRFLSAAFGSATLAIIPGMYVDIWLPAERGIATMFFAGTVFAGPTMGPVVGEYTVINGHLGWRWCIWITMIMAALGLVLALPTIPETLAPLILSQRAARIRRETQHWALHSKLDENPVTFSILLSKYGLKPWRMLILEPILLVSTIYISLVYAILYLIFFAFPYSFEFDRRWHTGVAALPFIAIFVGVVVGAIMMILETKLVFQPRLARTGKLVPEDRLPPMMAGSVILVIGLFWFAWTSFPGINPWPQIISGAFIGCGIFLVFISAVIYLVDIYLMHANSANAANACVRAFVGAAFPLFSIQMYQRLGVQWATSLLAFLCLALVPFPFILYFYGKNIRSRSRFAKNG